MNGLTTIVNALATPRRAPVRDRNQFPGMTRTDALRRMLTGGPAGSGQLSEQSGLSASRVSALLHHDVRRGRIDLRQGLYRLNPEYDQRHDAELRAAMVLLRAAGYRVIAPVRRES